MPLIAALPVPGNSNFGSDKTGRGLREVVGVAHRLAEEADRQERRHCQRAAVEDDRDERRVHSDHRGADLWIAGSRSSPSAYRQSQSVAGIFGFACNYRKFQEGRGI